MEVIINIDLKDYDNNWPIFHRTAAKGIIFCDGKILMQKSSLTGEYKIVGGVQEDNETLIETLKREVIEESGYKVKEETIKELGTVVEKRKDRDDEKIYLSETYLYLCEVYISTQYPLQRTENEIEKDQLPVFVDPQLALETNRTHINDYKWVDREIKILEYLIENGIVR